MVMTPYCEEAKTDQYLEQIRQGDGSALDLLYQVTSKQLYALCYAYTRNHHDSEDALSETYLSVVRHIDSYRGRNGRNWLYTIAKNTCISLLRKRSRTVQTDFDDEKTVNTLGLFAEERQQLYDESGIVALSQSVLNDREFQILILHAVNGLRFKDVARLVGGPEGTVRWQYNNALKKVKKAYERRSE